MSKRIDFVSHMFDTISKRYDRVNRILSFGLDLHWRKKVASCLPAKENLHVLDLATGTADQLIAFFQKNKEIEKAVGIDLSDKMLEVGQAKINKKPYADKVTLQKGSALSLPYDAESFDVVSVSFGVRNFSDPLKGLREMHRVLRQDGLVLILEFSLPKQPIVRKLSLFHLRYILPFIGGKLTAQNFAYEYLSQTIQTFPSGKSFCKLMENAGFQKNSIKTLCCGMVSIYMGRK